MSKKRLNLHEQGYKAGDPMWVSWDKRWDGPMRRELMWEGVYQEERLVTTIGFFRYDNREFLALDRTKRPNGCEDIIYIPTPLVKEYGKFHAEQYSTFIRYIFVYNTLVSERLNVRIRRYAEATNYAKVLTGVYNGIPKGENGMIIKYQNPPHGIARRDAIKDYRPNIPNRIRKATPAKHIQSMINIYGQSEQPIVTSDAKSPWQHQQAHEAASKGYDDYMQAKKYEEGLHNLNGILTFTDYATLATGLGSLLSKGASMAGRYAGKQMAKRAVGKEFKRQSKHLATPANNSLLVDMSGVTPRPLSEFSSLSDAELAKLLPDYAHPNWQGDGFKLVKERLWNGGFDRLEKYGDISRYSPQQRTIILNSNPKIETSVTLGEQPGTGTYRETYSINKDVLRDYTLQQSSDVKAHEMVHYMYRPSKEQEAELAYNVRQYFKRPEGRDYFRKSRATEQTARGTQIKNYYGLNEGNQDITPAMWEYARRNYVKDTGINNNMTEWLNSVDERDISAFVKWLSNNAPVIAAPLIGGTMYGNKDSK